MCTDFSLNDRANFQNVNHTESHTDKGPFLHNKRRADVQTMFKQLVLFISQPKAQSARFLASPFDLL
jgi:hypothetical protein